ncbi:MAG: glycosyltransferase family 1 protein [bacterium]|nr:glycosyltransferase family 1 protein [bacterium]
MKISIDISPVIYQTGVSWYTASLVRELVKLSKSDEFILFGGSLRRKHELDQFVSSVGAENVESKNYFIPPSLLSYLWNSLHIFHAEMFVGDVDVFHSSDWTQPPTKAYKVTTIHDLVQLRFPELSHPNIVSTHKRRLKWVKKEVDKIIAVSEFTKQEIVELLDIDSNKIVVIPEAPQEQYKPAKADEVNVIRKKYNLPNQYLLAVGANPRKNLPNIVKAFNEVKKKNKDLSLLVIGQPWGEVPKSEDVIYLGHVPSEEMPALYSAARSLVYTSLYEGFGLPILEAMASGCPVVTSNITSMPETAGDGAVLVNPSDSSEITLGIENVLQDRNSWIKKGLARAKQFSWKKTAQQTLEVYKQQT